MLQGFKTIMINMVPKDVNQIARKVNGFRTIMFDMVPNELAEN